MLPQEYRMSRALKQYLTNTKVSRAVRKELIEAEMSSVENRPAMGRPEHANSLDIKRVERKRRRNSSK